jgi:hypothetical protein
VLPVSLNVHPPPDFLPVSVTWRALGFRAEYRMRPEPGAGRAAGADASAAATFTDTRAADSAITANAWIRHLILILLLLITRLD